MAVCITIMQSKAKTVAQYLASLPDDRRAALEAVQTVVRKNLDTDFSEQMQYGMIGWCVPHSIYPAGYHCDPKQPLPFAGLASQKNYMSLYMMCLYADGPELERFRKKWATTGKKLDMGKACIRFKKIEDLALDVIGDTFSRITAKRYIQDYERIFQKKSPAKKRSRS